MLFLAHLFEGDVEYAVVGDVDDGADRVQVVSIHLLDLSLLAHQPEGAAVRGLAQADRASWEVVIVVEVREDEVEPWLEDFSYNNIM